MRLRFFPENQTTLRMPKWFILIKRLMHVCTRHDQITLFSVLVNSEVKISDHTQEILHVNVANVSIAAEMNVSNNY